MSSPRSEAPLPLVGPASSRGRRGTVWAVGRPGLSWAGFCSLPSATACAPGLGCSLPHRAVVRHPEAAGWGGGVQNKRDVSSEVVKTVLGCGTCCPALGPGIGCLWTGRGEGGGGQRRLQGLPELPVRTGHPLHKVIIFCMETDVKEKSVGVRGVCVCPSCI